MSGRCARCPGDLYPCDVLSGLTVCVECDRQDLLILAGDEWSLFTAAIQQAAVGGVVHQNDVRPIIRGRIQPSHIGQMYRRAKRLGLLVPIGHEESKDFAGKNAGRLEPRYELRSAA